MTCLSIDTHRLFVDNDYKQLLIEYNLFVSYILRDIHHRGIYSSSVKFHETNVLYKMNAEFMRMLQDTFPTFDVTLETHKDADDLDEDECSVSVNWANHLHQKN